MFGPAYKMRVFNKKNRVRRFGIESMGTNKPADLKKKLVIVGDDGCGKTSLLIAFAEHRFPEVYVPTVFEQTTTRVPFEGKSVELALWDTIDLDEYDRLRPLSYPGSDVHVIVFSVNLPSSLANVQDKWCRELVYYSKGVPYILVGTKTDLRQDEQTKHMLEAQGQHLVSTEEGQEAACKIEAQYAECSAKAGTGVFDVLELALRESVRRRRVKTSKKGYIIT